MLKYPHFAILHNKAFNKYFCNRNNLVTFSHTLVAKKLFLSLVLKVRYCNNRISSTTKVSKSEVESSNVSLMSFKVSLR